jgi:hypothetical protein
VTALEKTWHTEHFFCAQCGQQFGEDGFHERDGKPYCRADYFDMFAPKCGGCSKPIMENYISALNTQWHPDCFVCKVCIHILITRYRKAEVSWQRFASSVIHNCVYARLSISSYRISLTVVYLYRNAKLLLKENHSMQWKENLYAHHASESRRRNKR